MKVCLLVSHYSSDVFPQKGPFFRCLAEGLAEIPELEVMVLAPLPYSNSWIEKYVPSLKGNSLLPRFSFENGVKIFRPRYLRLPFIHKWGISHYLMFASVKRILKNEKPDLVDLRIGFPAYPLSHLALRIKKRFKIPFIYTMNGIDFDINIPVRTIHDKQFVELIKASSASFTVSVKLSERLSGKTGIHFGVQHHPLNLSPDVHTRSRLLGNWDSTYCLEILFVGALSREKGVDFLLEAWQQVVKYKWRLTLVGEGELYRSIAHENVRFLGRKSKNEISQLLDDSDLFCFFSRNDAMPNAVKEAAWHGLPVFALGIDSLMELSGEGQNAYLLSALDIDEFNRTLDNIILNIPSTLQKAQAMQKGIRNRFSQQNAAAQTFKVYKEIINE